MNYFELDDPFSHFYDGNKMKEEFKKEALILAEGKE